MVSSLTTLLPPTRSGRTFFVASFVLGACAFVQLMMLGWFLLHGSRPPTQTTLPIIHFAETIQPGVPAIEPPLQPVPYQAMPALAVAPKAGDADPVYPLIARPTPAATTRASSEGSDLLEQARQLRQRGDTNAALGKLREAQVAEPDNPQIVAEMAITYDAMQLPDKAAEQWQRLYGMGESIGALYYLADSKLHGAPTSASGTFEDASPNRTASQANAMLKITDIRLEELEDPAAERKLALKIVVKNRPSVVIDPTKVKIEAYFYDLVDGRNIVQTDAQTAFAWLTPAPINWANDKSEILEAVYMRVKEQPTPTLTPEVPRSSTRRNARNPKGEGSRAGGSGHGDTAPRRHAAGARVPWLHGAPLL